MTPTAKTTKTPNELVKHFFRGKTLSACLMETEKKSYKKEKEKSIFRRRKNTPEDPSPHAISIMSVVMDTFGP